MSQGEVGLSSDLVSEYIRAPKINTVKSFRTPLGRIMFTRDKGESVLLAGEQFVTNVEAIHRDGDGKLIEQYDLGSGLVTNVFVLGMAIDAIPSAAAEANKWPQTNQPTSTLQRIQNHATGTGATAAAATDIKLQTPSANGGQTMVAGTPTVVLSGTGAPKYQSVATISYTGSEAVTEWGFLGDLGSIGGTALSSATGSPFTAGSATTGTVTATPLTASSTTVRGQTQTVAEDTNGTRADWGLVVSNTTSVVTVPAWYTTAAGAAGSAPVNADTMVFRPILADHKVFAAINVASGDSIQFTYTLQINSGG